VRNICVGKSQRAEEYPTNNKNKANWIGHILHRNCLLKCAVEGKIQGRADVTGRRGRGRKKLLDDKKMRGY
jgi:hypothetical protein